MKDAYFGDVSFSNEADFGSVTFEKNALFQDVTFGGYTFFNFATFKHDCNFKSSNILGYSHFSKTRFLERSVFVDCQFEMPTNFRNAQFKETYPEFDGAVFHQSPTFSASEKGEFPKLDMKRGEIGLERRCLWPAIRHRSGSELEAARMSVSAIRHSVAQQGKPEDEHFFFRKEMGFAARIGGFWQRLPYRIFGIVSDFGYSVARPVAGLGVVWFLSAFFGLIVFIAVEGRFAVGENLAAASEAAALSLANMLPFLGFRGLNFETGYFADLPVVLKVLGGAQTIASFVLLFFLGLGLRTRFRLR